MPNPDKGKPNCREIILVKTLSQLFPKNSLQMSGMSLLSGWPVRIKAYQHKIHPSIMIKSVQVLFFNL